MICKKKGPIFREKEYHVHIGKFMVVFFLTYIPFKGYLDTLWHFEQSYWNISFFDFVH